MIASPAGLKQPGWPLLEKRKRGAEAASGKRKAEGRKAEGRKQEAEGRETEDRKPKAESRRQGNGRQKAGRRGGGLEALRYIEENLMIQDKTGALRPFLFNAPQRALYAEVRRQQQAGLPVRVIILKARQIGFSSAVAALFYQRAATTPNTNAMIVAHKAEASANIFNKIKLFWECSPPAVRPMKKAGNAHALLLENPSSRAEDRLRDPGLRSRITIESAGNREAGRSATIQLLHLSELAFWPYAGQAMAALMQAVPPLPQTMVVIESTANGVGGAFYREWQRAAEGRSAFVPLFFPWFSDPAYRMA